MVNFRPQWHTIEDLALSMLAIWMQVPLDYYRDSVGPLGRTVTDVALVFQALPGPDSLDGLTGLIETLNVTLEDNYTQYLKKDGLEVLQAPIIASISNHGERRLYSARGIECERAI